MPQTQAKAPGDSRLARRIVTRLVVIAFVAAALLWVGQRSSASFDRQAEPAGFARGLLHGALMPMALPSLLIGRDVKIYAASNTGRLYKLGYTVGVNGCGLIFFGFVFWRVSRMRRGLQVGNRSAGESAVDRSPRELRMEH
jgi:hypothetical protein